MTLLNSNKHADLLTGFYLMLVCTYIDLCAAYIYTITRLWICVCTHNCSCLLIYSKIKCSNVELFKMTINCTNKAVRLRVSKVNLAIAYGNTHLCIYLRASPKMFSGCLLIRQQHSTNKPNNWNNFEKCKISK